MKNDGIFLVQCTGAPAHGNLDSLFDTLYEFRFAPLFCGLAVENIPSRRSAATASFAACGAEKKQFVLNNLVMVKEGHRLFASAYDRRNYRHGYAADFPPLSAIYATNTSGRHYTKPDLLSLVLTRLAGQEAKANA